MSNEERQRILREAAPRPAEAEKQEGARESRERARREESAREAAERGTHDEPTQLSEDEGTQPRPRR